MLRNISLLLCLLVSTATAQIYTVGAYGDDMLRTIDPATGATLTAVTVTDTGAGTVFQFNGMAMDPTTGTVYVVVDLGAGRALATLNIVAATVTSVGTFGDEVAGIAFDPSGNLFAVVGDGGGNSESFHSVNKATGALTLIAALGNGNDGETIGTTMTGQIIHCSGIPGPIEFLNTTTGTATFFTTGPDEVSCITGTTTGNNLLVTIGGDFHSLDGMGNTTLIGFLDHSAKGIMDAALVPMPCNGLYPGTGDDYLLLAGVNGGLADCSQQSALPGDVLDVLIISPLGGLVTTPPVITGQFFATGTTAPFINVLMGDGIWVDPFVVPGPFIVYDGQANPFGGLGLPPQGLGFQFFVGAGLSGVSCMLNCFTISPLAGNNIFGATEGIEIQFM